MEDLNFSEKDKDNRQNNSNERVGINKSTKIIFDYNQLDYIKFRLTFSDGFMFGLGVIVAWIIVSTIMFLLLTITGASFFRLLL